MKEKNKIIYLSVVMSVYNGEQYIRKAVESILNQTYPYFEFIIVNDGSTDETIHIIKSFKDNRIILINKSNTGLADSLNIGIKSSKYDWILRMDCDDISLPNRFEIQVNNISNNVSVIGGQADYINDNETIICKSKQPITHNLIVKKLKLGISPFIHPTVLMNKKLITKIGGYDKNLISAQDIDLWYRLIIPKKKFINLPDVVIKYRINEKGISKKQSNNQTINSIIAGIKFYNSIYRQLENSEYNIIVEKVIKSKKYHFIEKLLLLKSRNKSIIIKKIYSAMVVLIKYSLMRSLKFNITN